MTKLLIAFLLFAAITHSQEARKKLPSISAQNVLNCFPELKNESLDVDVNLSALKKQIDQKYQTLKSVLRYRKILYTDPRLGTDRHRLTLSLQSWVKEQPQYDFYLEKLDKDNVAEMVPVSKEKFKNPLKEVPQKYLLSATLIDDESLWLDTKPNKLEMSYKTSNDAVVELDLSHTKGKVQLRCENKKTQGVLCLCLKR
jgi:hypothetical protein